MQPLYPSKAHSSPSQTGGAITYCSLAYLNIAPILNRVNFTPKTTPVRVHVPPQVVRDFAGVRGRVQNAVAASPQSVSFSAASQQVRTFRRLPPKK